MFHGVAVLVMGLVQVHSFINLGWTANSWSPLRDMTLWRSLWRRADCNYYFFSSSQKFTEDPCVPGVRADTRRTKSHVLRWEGSSRWWWKPQEWKRDDDTYKHTNTWAQLLKQEKCSSSGSRPEYWGGSPMLVLRRAWRCWSNADVTGAMLWQLPPPLCLRAGFQGVMLIGVWCIWPFRCM